MASRGVVEAVSSAAKRFPVGMGIGVHGAHNVEPRIANLLVTNDFIAAPKRHTVHFIAPILPYRLEQTPSATASFLNETTQATGRVRDTFSRLSQAQCPAPSHDNFKLPSATPSSTLPDALSCPTIAHDTCYVIEGPECGVFHIYDVGPTCLFNRLRTDTKHRKRAFTKRGCFRQSRSVLRKENRMKFAYALQGIDYDLLAGLKMGEIPDIRAYKR
ncbi:tRNA-dihydrouridine(16/17) synthase, putative [Babesia caballi]|uniref:tRNA-dihydrouridine(16/17) synthase, putative n=1 Tax=Babesia caballi TaxID=5871 RepID=A0AAV4M1Z6_BABCB|nr:tRNA-dihydrouridine(16/17) synthase, putative [Babesia caballi]